MSQHQGSGQSKLVTTLVAAIGVVVVARVVIDSLEPLLPVLAGLLVVAGVVLILLRRR